LPCYEADFLLLKPFYMVLYEKPRYKKTSFVRVNKKGQGDDALTFFYAVKTT